MRRIFILFLPLVSSACAGKCPEDSTVVWADVDPIFEEHCVRCHSSELVGDAREGAWVGFDYDHYEVASKNAVSAYVEVNVGDMPADEESSVSDAEKEMLRQWAACKTPE